MKKPTRKGAFTVNIDKQIKLLQDEEYARAKREWEDLSEDERTRQIEGVMATEGVGAITALGRLYPVHPAEKSAQRRHDEGTAETRRKLKEG